MDVSEIKKMLIVKMEDSRFSMEILPEEGCIVKTAGVDEEILKFTGKIRLFESQDAAVEEILADKIKEGDVVLIIYEGPKGGLECKRCCTLRHI